ncbi:MAG: nicotinate-nucleotide adenylyltransferase [Colwellia sp.]|nr:nicotinate-nucleotide adenylyltransferase [Colwellia sp.]
MSTHKKECADRNIIAIMGGTFDPIHRGHIETAKETAKWLNVDQLTLLPAHIPPHKDSTTASALHREKMVELVCQQQPLFHLDNRELKRDSSSYTVTSLQEIKQEQPKSKIFFIIGMDSLLNFTTWHQWQTIISLCHLVVNVRPGYPLNQINTATQELLNNHQINNINEIVQRDAGGIILHKNQSFDISSSEIRQQFYDGYLKENILTKTVHQYIIQEKLYQKITS